MSDSVVIAIDGPAASGKGTLARRLAAHFDYAHLDTGTLYRAIGVMLIRDGHTADDTNAAINIAHTLTPAHLDDPDVVARLRDEESGRVAAKIAVVPELREAVLALQRHIAAHPPEGRRGAVLDGRDIGTVVCPDAAHKFFVTARLETRAERRFLELGGGDPALTFEAVRDRLAARDAQDESRAVAPLRAADDAHLLDTSDLSIDEAFQAALTYILDDGR